MKLSTFLIKHRVKFEHLKIRTVFVIYFHQPTVTHWVAGISLPHVLLMEGTLAINATLARQLSEFKGLGMVYLRLSLS